MKVLNLTRWPTICIFAFAGLIGASFAFTTVNLFTQAAESLRFIAEFGTEAIRHGALWQVAELFVSGALSLFFWVAFKISEHALIERYFDWGHDQRAMDGARQEMRDDVNQPASVRTQESDRVT